MQFEPKTERQLKEEMILPDGEYDFEVGEAKDGTSKSSGNEMVTLNLKVFSGERMVYVRDWLTITNSPRSQLKIYNFCQSTGIMSSYDEGILNAHVCDGLAGRVLIGHQDSEDFGLQNRVVDYIPPAPKAEPKESLGVPAAQTRAANKAAEQRATVSGESEWAEADIPF